ncbi:hypothetical protein [Virgibacillus salexigens]|uniref:Uncharacterized protein n=1 Tax=Virgibacillus kapii TaxID=1638645 RepID=A0ABQ2DX14_9BACI|nr:hypothetical protein [Virgibacillus kapii]GGJ76380.1 hypothetical protein GCM10007111_42470 [Virgibacillus kapii]
MHFLKRFLITFLVLGFYFSGLAIAEASATDEYLFNTVEEIENEVVKMEEDSTSSDEEKRKFLFENSNPKALKKYIEDLMVEVKNAMQDLSNDVEFNTESPLNVSKDSIKLPNGGMVKATVTDSADASTGNIMPMEYVTKGFGDRRYTATYKVYHVAYPDTTLKLVNRYNISKSGLKMTSVGTGGTYAVFPTTVNPKSDRITDKYAQKEGWDINGQADYVVTVGGYNGIGLVTKTYTIRSTIKLVDLYSSSAYVLQKRTIDK